MDFKNWPNNVTFCKTCVMSNNRPASIIEFQHTPDRKNSKYLKINDDGECDACKQSKIKNEIRILVPPHIETGTKVVIKTEDRSYVERSKE